MARMAVGFEGVDFARARAAQATASPAIWSVFPAAIEIRRKIFRCGNRLVALIAADDFQCSHSSSQLSTPAFGVGMDSKVEAP